MSWILDDDQEVVFIWGGKHTKIESVNNKHANKSGDDLFCLWRLKLSGFKRAHSVCFETPDHMIPLNVCLLNASLQPDMERCVCGCGSDCGIPDVCVQHCSLNSGLVRNEQCSGKSFLKV